MKLKFKNNSDKLAYVDKEISDFTEEELRKLYYLYEFSDDVFVISEDVINYPTIFNYVKTGILSLEEAMEALLQ